MVSTIPVEPLDLGVWAVLVGCPPGEVLLVERVVTLEHRVQLFHRFGAAATMRVLPRAFRRVDVVLDVLDVLAALQHQHAEPLFGELLGGPPAGDAGAYHDRVVVPGLHRASLSRSTERPP